MRSPDAYFSPPTGNEELGFCQVFSVQAAKHVMDCQCCVFGAVRSDYLVNTTVFTMSSKFNMSSKEHEIMNMWSTHDCCLNLCVYLYILYTCSHIYEYI